MKLYLYSIVIIIVAQLSVLSDEASDKKALNDVMAERAELMIKAHYTQAELNKAWSDKALTSPEIEKLRARYQELSLEMHQVREKIKAEVAKLPQIKVKAEEVKAVNSRKDELEEKIKELS